MIQGGMKPEPGQVRPAPDATRRAVALALARRPSSGASTWVIVLGAVLISPLLGLAAVFGLVPLLALASLIGAAALMAYPIAALWVLAVGALCVAGMVELYLPGLQQVRWVFVLMALMLAAKSVLDRLIHPGTTSTAQASAAGGAVIVPLAALFFAISAASALIGGNGVISALSGLKGYFQIWGLWIAIVYGRPSLQQTARFVWWLLPIMVLQWPVVLHQYLFLVPLRRALEITVKGLVAIDVVSGTFGGALGGGGRSPVLAVLAMAGLTLAVSCYRAGRIRSLALTWLLVALCVGPLAFSEVKIVFIFLPLTLLLLFGRLVASRPLTVLVGSLVTVAALYGALTLYAGMIAVKRGPGSQIEDYVYSSLGYNVGSEGHGNAGLNRVKVYEFWWTEHDRAGGLARTLFGHGPGVVNTTSVAAQESIAIQRYAGFFPGLTGLSTLLWEVGVVGTALFLAWLAAVFAQAGRLVRHPGLSAVQPELAAARVIVALLTVSLVHNNLLLIDLATQAMLALAVALVLVASREAPRLPAPAGRVAARAFGIRPLRVRRSLGG